MTKKIMIPVVIILLLAAVIGTVLYLQGETREDTGLEIDPNASSGPTLPTSEAGEPQGIRIAGYPELTIPAGETDVVLNLLNPEGNPCYFTFCITLKDTGEVLYTSKAVEPGMYIGVATLSRALEAGEYDANIHIATNSLEDNSPMNDANLETRLIVK